MKRNHFKRTSKINKKHDIFKVKLGASRKVKSLEEHILKRCEQNNATFIVCYCCRPKTDSYTKKIKIFFKL